MASEGRWAIRGTRGLVLGAVVVASIVAAGCGADTPGAVPTSPAATTSTAPTRSSSTVSTSARRFSVRPTDPAVGQPVTVSGAGCPGSSVAHVAIGAANGVRGTAVEVAVGDDGTWRATVTVADGTLLGHGVATARCAERSTGRTTFEYPPVDVDVTTYRRLEVAPEAVRPGGSVTLLAVGGCPSPNVDHATVTLEPRADEDRPLVVEPVVAGAERSYSVDAQGAWQGPLPIPAATPPGDYVLRAVCGDPRGSTAWYPMVAVTVEAG